MKDEARKMAERIVEQMFTNGAGTQATRLVLVVDHPDPKVPYLDIGGYSRSALVDLITTTETTKPSFEDGVLWAVARIVELHDQPVIAADVLRESRIALNLRRVDEADRPFLKTVAQEPYFRNRRGQRS